jgi:hypothetical protein
MTPNSARAVHIENRMDSQTRRSHAGRWEARSSQDMAPVRRSTTTPNSATLALESLKGM